MDELIFCTKDGEISWVDKNGKTVMGYYAKRSHDIIPCTGCGLSSPHVSGIDEYVRLYIERAGWTEVRHLYMRCGTNSSGTVRVSVCLVARSRPDGVEAFARALTELFPQISGVLLIITQRIRMLYSVNGMRL